MPDDAQDITQKQVTLIPTDRIRILNPRVRNRRTFEEMVENIAKIGLKRPITVAQRAGTDPAEYDLVCGQGRLEAFMELQQDAIPAIIIDANESDCLVMSLVENCARRQHSPIDLMREIGNLRKRGYNDRQIANKIGVTPDYVGMIAGLLERGEERLVSAVETGLLPLNLAIDISKTDAEGGQRALMDAYTQKKLRGKKLAAVRRLIQQRDAQGPRLHRNSYGRGDGAKRPLTSDALVRAYKQEAERQKLLIKKAELTQGRLTFVVEAFRSLKGDDHFLTLLRGGAGHSAHISRANAGRGSGRMSRGKRKTPDAVALGFESDCVTVPVEAVLPVRALSASVKSSRKYRQITASIKEVGLVEPPVVTRSTGEEDTYMLLDGHIRIEVLKDLGIEQVECLISTDDEAFTYNKRISRLAPIQEHKMIRKAIERGVSEEKIALALDLNPRSIVRKAKLLDGICEEAVGILKDKHCATAVFEILRKMKAMRQIEAAELMMNANNYSPAYISAILAGTPQEQLVDTKKPKKMKGITPEAMARMERELARLQEGITSIQDSYGQDHLQLTVIKAYLGKLLGNARVVRYLMQHRPEFLTEFQAITDMASTLPPEAE